MDSPIGPMPPANSTPPAALPDAVVPVKPATPPGWFPDAASGNLRWWDGTQWTDQYAPVQPQIVIQQPLKETNHILHLLLSVFTLGLWIPVWIIVAIANADTRRGQRAGKW